MRIIDQRFTLGHLENQLHGFTLKPLAEETTVTDEGRGINVSGADVHPDMEPIR